VTVIDELAIAPPVAMDRAMAARWSAFVRKIPAAPGGGAAGGAAVVPAWAAAPPKETATKRQALINAIEVFIGGCDPAGL
jgi:hypothetical protein